MIGFSIFFRTMVSKRMVLTCRCSQCGRLPAIVFLSLPR
ncbi:hypothetical protein M5D96_001544 [Drosophila gunungcola]|uniref:Uncharacterized protein n=1 Tax=Drosophila gunungcola TaxID=103775 RepID=A0A9Q0BVI8_9MUSC|nr:hypothetical protein M5D96_001544 [Drosophila gunungcola]